MNFQPMLMAVALATVLCGSAHAAVSADQAARLGKDLTPWGGELAGNKDGTIPAYTGGLKNPPAGFNPSGGGKRWLDPYADEKPLYSINASNAAQYEDKLVGSAKEMF